VSCPSGYCPGVSSGSATFNGGQYLTASGSVPDLSGGRLTLSAWIYPQNRDSDEEFGYYWYQGILGNHRLGGATGYPTLDRLGLKLRFGFSTGTEWKEIITPNVLTLDGWNHVVVTYSQDDGWVRFYVNGVLRGYSNAGKYASIASPASFFIGRSTDQTKLTVVDVHIITTSDAGIDARPCMRRMTRTRSAWHITLRRLTARRRRSRTCSPSASPAIPTRSTSR